MKFTGTIAVGQSGSIAGITASHNRFATYYRQRAIPVNNNTVFQQTVRGLFGQFASRWTATLTQEQRDGWDAYANALPGEPLGINEYIASNVVRRQLSTPLAIVDAPPTTPGRASLTTPIVSNADASDAQFDLAFTNTDAWATAVGGALITWASRPFGQSINFFLGPYRYAGDVKGAVVPPVSPAVIASPFTLIAGQKLQVKLRCCNPDGRISPIVRQTVTIVA